MANITLSIDDALLQAARIRAVKEGTSVNEVCRKAIEAYARRSSSERLRRYRELAAQIAADPGVTGKPLPPISRKELYEWLLTQRGGRRK